RPISKRSTKPATARRASVSRIRPIIGAPSSDIPCRQSRSKGPRVKKAAPQHTSPATCACLTAFLLARQAPRRVSLNVAITADYGERRLDDGASSPLIIYAFDVADQIADDFL